MFNSFSLLLGPDGGTVTPFGSMLTTSGAYRVSNLVAGESRSCLRTVSWSKSEESNLADESGDRNAVKMINIVTSQRREMFDAIRRNKQRGRYTMGRRWPFS